MGILTFDVNEYISSSLYIRTLMHRPEGGGGGAGWDLKQSPPPLPLPQRPVWPVGKQHGKGGGITSVALQPLCQLNTAFEHIPARAGPYRGPAAVSSSATAAPGSEAGSKQRKSFGLQMHSEKIR